MAWEVSKFPRQGLHTGMVVDHHLAELDWNLNVIWKKGSSASYAPDSQFKPHIEQKV